MHLVLTSPENEKSVSWICKLSHSYHFKHFFSLSDIMVFSCDGSFPGFDTICPMSRSNTDKNRMRKGEMERESTRDSPLQTPSLYDADLHQGIASLRILDGSMTSKKPGYGPSVIFFAPKGKAKFWIRANQPPFG